MLKFSECITFFSTFAVLTIYKNIFMEEHCTIITTSEELIHQMKKDFTLGESYIFYLLINKEIDIEESLIEQTLQELQVGNLMDFLMKESQESLDLVNAIVSEVFTADLELIKCYYTFYKLFVTKNLEVKWG